MDNSRENYCCPNCQNILAANEIYCSGCGQKRIHPEDRSVWHLIVESVGDFFHFDSKFFGTLLSLFFRPGFLTKEFLAGKRAKYFQPFKLFLFISFIYFLVTGIMNQKDSVSLDEKTGIHDTAKMEGISRDKGGYNFHLAEIHDGIMDLPDDSIRKMVKKQGLNSFVNLNYPSASWLSRFLIKQVLKNRLQGSETFSDNMHRTIPKLIFILIPFMAFLLKLLYIRRKIPYFDHMIFSLHFLSFIFLLLLIKDFGSLLWGGFNVVIYILLLGYLYFALLKVYRQNLRATLGKFLLLFFGSLTMLAFFFIIAASISFLMI
jgi:hypothetical protein